MQPLDVVFVGPCGNTHICSSLDRAARDLGLTAGLRDTTRAYAGSAVVRVFLWHFGDRRPPRLRRFSAELHKLMGRNPPCILLTAGSAPVRGDVLRDLRSRGVVCLNYATDDPFNPAVKAQWHLRDLTAYDMVLTPRRSNIDDLRKLGCPDVRYLPFGYDEHLFSSPENDLHSANRASSDVLFVGGADRERAEFFADFLRCGMQPKLVGSNWDRYASTRKLSLGQKPAEELRRLTAGAAVNLCLVRRANRDGHVMRSFEIPAIGGFMLAEDTEEHREIFGPEGKCVLYFRTPEEAAEKSRWALANPAERARMAGAAHDHITRGGHSYKDRLQVMLKSVAA